MIGRFVVCALAILLLFVANVCGTEVQNRAVGVSLSYSPNMGFPQKLVESLSYSDSLQGGDLTLHLVEKGGRRADLCAEYELDHAGILSHTFLANASYTYGLCAWGGLGYMLGLGWDFHKVDVGLALGVQLGSAFSHYYADVLFSITPLAKAFVELSLDWLKACAYMDFATPYGREWKAVPTVGGKVSLKIYEPCWIGCEAFVKFAEYLTDTRTMVSAHDVRLSFEYGIEGGR